MHRSATIFALSLTLVACGDDADDGPGAPTPTPTESATPTPTQSASPTPSVSPTPSESPTSTPPQSPTPSPSQSPTPTPSESPTPSPTPTGPVPGPIPIHLTFDFASGPADFEAGFADYPAGEEDFYMLTGEHVAQPAELGPQTAYRLSGNNHSDDLFMFIKGSRRVDFRDISDYRTELTLTFASSVPTGCAGIGGSPGESVYVKAGVAAVEPEAVEVSGDEFLRLNVDKGNQSQSGRDATVLGTVGNGLDCNEVDFGNLPWRQLELSGTLDTKRFSADDSGDLWFFVGTDSGFEGSTEIYIQRLEVTFVPAL